MPRPIASKAVEVFCRSYGVDLTEAEVPSRGFDCFDDFFTRQLRPGSRPVDPDIESVVSPADGLVQDGGSIESGAVFRVKGRLYLAEELLGDREEARRFEGGSFVLIYLNPRDYHRVHAPVSGGVESVSHIGGTLFPVNDLGLNHIGNLFARNERVVFRQQSSVHGAVTTIMVGALGVGRISVSFDRNVITNNGPAAGTRVYRDRKPLLERGDEMGVFHLGSTVIVFMTDESPRMLVKRSGERVRVGEAIARKP